MSHRRVLGWVLFLMAGCGLLEGRALMSSDLHLLVGLAIGYLSFCWYCGDSDARGYRRSRWMSAGMVAFTAGVLPYYLLRSRVEGERGQALTVYAAYLALAAMALWVGIAVRIGLE